VKGTTKKNMLPFWENRISDATTRTYAYFSIFDEEPLEFAYSRECHQHILRKSQSK